MKTEQTQAKRTTPFIEQVNAQASEAVGDLAKETSLARDRKAAEKAASGKSWKLSRRAKVSALSVLAGVAAGGAAYFGYKRFANTSAPATS